MQQSDYHQLTPDTVIDAVESIGVLSDSRTLIAKFYRPNRWSDGQILEEHDFTQTLADLDIPVVPPLRFDNTSLMEHQGYRFALYKRYGGHAPELDNPEHLEVIGRAPTAAHFCSTMTLYPPL